MAKTWPPGWRSWASKHLGYWENGFRHITNSIRPIYKPEDLKGIKLRNTGKPCAAGHFHRLWRKPNTYVLGVKSLEYCSRA